MRTGMRIRVVGHFLVRVRVRTRVSFFVVFLLVPLVGWLGFHHFWNLWPWPWRPWRRPCRPFVVP